MTSRVVRIVVPAIAIVAIASCSSSPATDTSLLSLTLDSPTAAVVPGGSALVPGTLTRNNFTGDVEYVLDNAPSGITGEQVFVPGTTTEPFKFEIHATPDVPLGTYALAVRAIGGSGNEASAKLTLTVAATVPGDIISLAASPSAVSLTLGGPGVTVTVTPTFLAGYTGGFVVSTSGTSLLDDAVGLNVSARTFTVTFTPTTGLVAGTYPVVLSASGADGISRSVTVVVTVH